jgi:uncharacterized protein
MKNEVLQIGNITIQPGERITLALPTPELYSCTPMHVPIHIIHGKKKGPCLLICAALHGDETNGILIITKLFELVKLDSLKGTLIVIPVANIYGLIAQTRNLADGRDLEKCFPGMQQGSFAARFAYQLNHEILQKADYCIDLHTGGPSISKFPQVLTNLNIEDNIELAMAFKAPITMHTDGQEGLLFLSNQRSEQIIPTLRFVGGEAQRLDEHTIKVGLKGIRNVLKLLNMIPIKKKFKQEQVFNNIFKQRWVYAPSSGICETFKKLGSYIKKGELIARITDPFGSIQISKIVSPIDGIIIAIKTKPLVNEGDYIVQIAEHNQALEVSEQIQNND